MFAASEWMSQKPESPVQEEYHSGRQQASDTPSAYKLHQHFHRQQDTIYAHRSAELFKNRRTVSVANTRSTARSSKGKSSSQGDVTYHRIRNGETLSTIARKYGVTVNQIKSWNGLRSTRINAGKRLKIYK